MKKLAAALLLVSMLASPCHALNFIDKLIYKKDVLRANNKIVMVNRLTGEVKYMLRSDGQWITPEGQWKGQYQKLYNAQTGAK